MLIGTQLVAWQSAPESEGYIIMITPGSESKLKAFLNSENQALRAPYAIPLSLKLGVYLLSSESEKMLQKIEKESWLQYIGANRKIEYRGSIEPNDPMLTEQWGLEMIRAPEAWTFTTGGTTPSGHKLVAAIVDNGCDLEHEDLKDNIWINAGETPGSGEDEDMNGYIDDVFGWNVITQSGNTHPARGHGTAMAGIVGARGNNEIGVSGVNWEVDLMIISGAIFESDVILAYEYARVQRELYNNSQGQKGALVIATNSSFGISGAWPEDAPYWCAMYDALGEVGILSAGATDNSNIDVDVEGDIPSTCPSSFLIIATETNRNDQKASTGAYGKTYVDLGAPGDSHLTTRVGNLYTTTSGTSTATAFITGAIALLASYPNDDWEQMLIDKPAEAALLLKEFILRGAVQITDLKDKTSTGGRLDLMRSMQLMQEYFEGFKGQTHISTVYPNPFTEGFTIAMDLPEPGIYTLEIFDLSGRKIKSGDFDQAPFSFKTVEVNLSEFPASVYLLRLQGPDGSSSFRKIVKLQ